MANYVCTRPLTVGSDNEGASPRRFVPGDVVQLTAAEAKQWADSFRASKVKTTSKKKTR